MPLERHELSFGLASLGRLLRELDYSDEIECSDLSVEQRTCFAGRLMWGRVPVVSLYSLYNKEISL